MKEQQILYLDQNIKKRLKLIAAQKDMSLSEYVTQLIIKDTKGMRIKAPKLEKKR